MRRLAGFLTTIWPSLLVVMMTLLAWRPITTSDLFFHLSLGRAVWREGSRVVTEPTAFAELVGPRVVPQWLWDVGAYGLYEGFGPEALVVATMAVSALATWVLCRLVVRLAEAESPPAQLLVAGLGASAILMRIAARPQAMFMLLLPAAMALSWRYVRADGRNRVALGVGWIALLLFWTQVHGSFVIAPAIWLIIVAPAYWEDPASHRHWRVDAIVLAASGLALLTNAYGLDLIPYILAHGGGDAIRHNDEMMAPSWAYLTGSLLPALVWLLGPFGAIRVGRVRWREIGLAAFGVALALSAQRFNAAATILAAPLALSGAINLDRWARYAWPGAWHRLAPVLAIALVAVSFQAVRSASESVRGPVGRAGLTEGAHPIAAWAYLQKLPAGTNVLADYLGGAALAYFADGQLRTYVDGRTPLHFDDTEAAVYRDMGIHADALRRGIARYDVRAVVFDRNWPGCAHLAQLFSPAVIEARYTTFVPAGRAEPLGAIQPCGRRYLRARVCDDVGALDSAIARLTALGSSAFVRQLRAERILRCGGDVAEAAAVLPDEGDAFAFRPAHRRARIRLLLAEGDLATAADLLEEAVAEGDNSALEILLSPSSPELSPERTHAILEIAGRYNDDDASPVIRIAIARSCQVLGEVECVRFHALRAGLQGEPNARPLLRWASEQHPDERIRRDLRGWLRVIYGSRSRR